MKQVALLLGVLVAAVLLAPLVAPADPMQTDTMVGLQPPGAAHLLGTDRLGRDQLSRLLYGGQRTLLIAAGATLIASLVGGFIGLAGGAAGRRVDAALDLLLNAVLAFPGLLLALVVITLAGAGGGSVALATGISLIAPFARVTRGAVLSVRALGYVDAARSLGAPRFALITRHILPNIAPILLAYIGVTFSYSVLNSAALTFLGLGGDLGVPDWGVMLYEGRVTFQSAPWVALAPGLAITLTVYAVNVLVERVGKGIEPSP